MPLRLSGPPHNPTIERVVPSIAGGLQNLPLALWLESILTHKSMVHKENEVKSVSRSVVSDSLRPRGLWPARLLCPWDSPGKDTGVGNLSLLQGNLPNAGIKPKSPALQTNSLPSEPLGKPPLFSKLGIKYFSITPG